MATATAESGELELEGREAAKPRRIVASVDDDGLPEMRPAAVDVPTAPAVKPVPTGYPDPEAAPELIAERGNYRRLADSLRAVAAQRAELAAEIGVRPEWSLSHIDHITPKLLAAGVSFDQLDQFKALCERERQTREACRHSAERVGQIIEEARRKLAVRAADEMFKPAEEAEARALLAFLARREKRRNVVADLRAAGVDQAVSAVIPAAPCMVTTGQNPMLARLVECGHLSAEEVRAALPGITGI